MRRIMAHRGAGSNDNQRTISAKRGRTRKRCRSAPFPFVVATITLHTETWRSDVRYITLIYTNGADFESLSEAERNAISAEYFAISDAPGVVGGAQLQPGAASTTVRVRDGQTLTTDGPFIETKEELGGYYLFEADDLDAAIELAARIPAARMGGAVEVRPVVER
jgi:hypothetical protein